MSNQNEIDRLADEVLKEAKIQAPNDNFYLKGWDTTTAHVYISALLVVLRREGVIKLKEWS